MKRIVVIVALSFCAATVGAQDQALLEAPWEIDLRSMDVQPPGQRAPIPEGFAFELEAMGKKDITVETVGDPDSFGRKKTYLGMTTTRPVTIREDCSTYPPEPEYGSCIETPPAPDTLTVDETDLAVIELPKKATKSLLCFTFTPFATWEWYNDTGIQQTAQMRLRPTFRIESEVLEDPALIDPGTGLPFDGVLIESSVSTFHQMRSLDPDEYDYQSRSTTRSCTAGLVNRRMLSSSFELPDHVIDDFFKKPITVSFGVAGYVSMVTGANYRVGIRLHGD